MSIGSLSLISGPTPVVIIVLGTAGVLLSLRYHQRVWRRQLLWGLPIAGALVGLAAILVDGLALIPYQFPNSYYLWFGLILLTVVLAVVGWTRFRWWHRIFAPIAVALTAIMGFTLVNQEYGYYPTIDALFGKNAQHQVSPDEADKARQSDQNSGVMPKQGSTVQIAIPGPISGFQARAGYVWLPPAWFVDKTKTFPVIEMLFGSPGDPADWTRGALADQTANSFAAQHDGEAPILVMPDENGSATGDTECVNSPLGQAETYLTQDVPNFVRANYEPKAAATPAAFAVAGLSAGGMCANMLALRHPDLFPIYADFSGLTSPTPSERVDPAAAARVFFGGSTEQYLAHDPLHLMSTMSFPGLSGWYDVGTADSESLAAQRQLVPLAQRAAIDTCAHEASGAGHDFQFWTQAFIDSLPWISYKLSLTPKPASVIATCTPPF
ncbi:MAG: hypothetical protein JO147_09175 [Actinobacteria bacterium]|nr:hypothetical protein [Actinomycetota bacterium]